MTILAFLQNMWLYSPQSFARSMELCATPAEREKFRSRVIRYALFAGCLTGRRLKSSLGEKLCKQIIWEEANPFVADNPRDYYPPDPKHITKVLRKYKPDVVLCFTKRGETAIRKLCCENKAYFIACPHPASRQPDIMQFLRGMKADIEQHALEQGQ